jgi:hypothetical protein
MMKAALLFPQFAPNLYDLSIMLKADRIILQDVEQWSRKSRVHRARIRTPQGTQWIRIPIRSEDRKRPVNKLRIDHSRNWISPLLRSLEYNYRNSIYYDFYEPDIRNLFQSAVDFTYLQPFILRLFEKLYQLINVYPDYSLASDLPCYTSDPQQLTRNLNASELYFEQNSRHYQRRDGMVSDPGFTHPVYYQHFEGFEPDCCILDMLFQLGPECFRVTDQLQA